MMLSRLRSLVYMLPQLVHALFTRPSTVRFPFGPLDLPDYYRGRVVIDPERCRGCGACVRDCPAPGLVLVREGRDRVRLIHYPERCACCGQCEASCPSGAIRLSNECAPPSFGQEEVIEVTVDRNRK
jgi:hydrogenase-4 component H